MVQFYIKRLHHHAERNQTLSKALSNRVVKITEQAPPPFTVRRRPRLFALSDSNLTHLNEIVAHEIVPIQRGDNENDADGQS